MKIAFWIVVFILFASCRREGIKIPPHSLLNDSVMAIKLTDDTIRISLADDFQNLSGIQNIGRAEQFNVTIDEDNRSILITNQGSTALFENITFDHNGFRYNIPVLREYGEQYEGIGEPFIFPDKVRGDSIYFRNRNNVSDWYVYIQDYLLRRDDIIAVDSGVVIILPPQVNQMENVRIRLWAVNDAGISNGLAIPVKKGRVVIDPDELTHWHIDKGRKQNMEDIMRHLEAAGQGGDSSRIVEWKNFSQGSLAMNIGVLSSLRDGNGIHAYLYSYFEKDVIIVYNQGTEGSILKLDLPKKDRETGFRSLNGGRFSYNNSSLILDIPPKGIEIFFN